MKNSIFTVLCASVIAVSLLSGCVQGDSVKATPGLMSDKQFADTSNSRYWQHQKATSNVESAKMEDSMAANTNEGKTDSKKEDKKEVK